jgi:hypothetical protein
VLTGIRKQKLASNYEIGLLTGPSAFRISVFADSHAWTSTRREVYGRREGPDEGICRGGKQQLPNISSLRCAVAVTNSWFERFNLTRSRISLFRFRPLQDAKFVIESRDVHRNKTTSGCKPFVVSVRGAVTPQVHCIKGDNGEYHYSYRTAKVKTASTPFISARIWAAHNTHCCLDTITLWLKFSRVLHTLFGRGV